METLDGASGEESEGCSDPFPRGVTELALPDGGDPGCLPHGLLPHTHEGGVVVPVQLRCGDALVEDGEEVDLCDGGRSRGVSQCSEGHAADVAGGSVQASLCGTQAEGDVV